MGSPSCRYLSRSPCRRYIGAKHQRSDMLRYLMLLVEGGIYSNTDTQLLQPPSKWGQGATLWADGKGLSKQEKARIAAGEEWKEVLGPPSSVLGLEADAGTREDWHKWVARPVSCSWMIDWLLLVTSSRRQSNRHRY